ncbi:MAG: T9SS type A sorting domain-containing protein, partial [Bacteroidales bacterium]|nr:T9SS type A sorting domain-containing protein [Bacteroidales bacterium]
TVEPTDSTEFAVTTDSCYIWNGLAYCASGNYTQIIQNAYGCDSVVTLHLTVTVGIDGYNGFDIVLYPNPAREILNVQCTMGDVCGEDATVELLDVYGKLLQTVRMSPETTTLNVGGLASGVYFVRVTTDRGTVTKPFVKK